MDTGRRALLVRDCFNLHLNRQIIRIGARACGSLGVRCSRTLGLRRRKVVGQTRHLMTRMDVRRTGHRLRSTQGSLRITDRTLGDLVGVKRRRIVHAAASLFVGRDVPSTGCFGRVVPFGGCLIGRLGLRRGVTNSRLGVNHSNCLPGVTLVNGRALCTSKISGCLVPHAVVKINFA